MLNRSRKPLRAQAGRAHLLLCLLPAAYCLLLAGCNSGAQVHRDLYTRELRLQEDEIYRLEDYLEEYQQIVRSLRCENQQLKQQLLNTSPAEASTDTEEHSLLDKPGDDSSTDKFIPPEIDLGEPIEPPVDTPPAEQPPGGDQSEPPPIDIPVNPEEEAPPFNPGAAPAVEFNSTTPQSPKRLAPELIESPIHELLPTPAGSAAIDQPTDLNPTTHIEPLKSSDFLAPQTVYDVTLRGEMGAPQPTGEATLIAIVSPQAADGAAAPFSGEASFMLRDLQVQMGQTASETTRLARWDFTEQEVADSWGDLTGSPVLDFALVLPDDAPLDRPLEFWVRLVDSEGRKILSKTSVTLERTLDVAEQAPALFPPADEHANAVGWQAAPTGPSHSTVRVATYEESRE